MDGVTALVVGTSCTYRMPLVIWIRFVPAPTLDVSTASKLCHEMVMTPLKRFPSAVKRTSSIVLRGGVASRLVPSASTAHQSRHRKRNMLPPKTHEIVWLRKLR